MGDVDCRPLLSNSRENLPPSLLQSPSLSTQRQSRWVDSTWVLPEDGGNGAHATTLADGTSNDARGSVFSSLSFSARSDAGASHGNASSSFVAAALLRPFQALRMWCRGSVQDCCGPLCRRGSWFSRVGLSVEDEEESVAIVNEPGDALRDSFAPQRSRRHRGNTFPAATPSAGGDQGHSHRLYRPPRSRSSEAGFSGGVSTASTSPREHAGLVREGILVPRSDSLEEGSFAESSTPLSSLSLSRHARSRGGGEGGHLVMQRGVLMRMAADGTCTRVPETHLYTPGCRSPALSPHLSGETNAGHALQLAHSESLGNVYGHVGSSPPARGGEDASRAYSVALALEEMEASRQPLRTLEQISAALTTCGPYLPFRVEVETDLASATPSPAPDTEAMPAARDSASKRSTPAPTLPRVPLSLHVLGPLLPCPTAKALRALEDILLEDCDGSLLPLCALHCADLDLRRVRMGEDGDDARPGIATLLQRSQSNPFLDLLVSPTTNDYAGTIATVSQVLDFLKRLVAARAAQLTTLHFTRCYFVPHDVGQSIPLPLATVRRLRFEHCPLTPAHVDALLALARQQDALAPSQLGEAHGVSSSPSRRSLSFGALEELQLSGSVTPECISELLDYVEEQQQKRNGGGQGVTLRQLCVPSSVVCAAKAHPFVQANGTHVVVVSAHV
ncbi:hypothetical protein LSCM1_03124 [Leishmania martiniquensis]|uniref:Uncharacterized protein n=1 Tax=Leishmania martiniquensis TaxID=1580590 RepID=A0A836GII1_9TRYP|nr:hypothetical protein LSCM1_03124 [Leishmania martiniquensis]